MACALMVTSSWGEESPIIPVIKGECWSIASTPQLPQEYHNDQQQPVDFGIWQSGQQHVETLVVHSQHDCRLPHPAVLRMGR